MDRPRPTIARLDGNLALWCNFDKKWGNHIGKECYNHIRFMRNKQMVGGMQNYALASERPLLVLHAQPSLSNAAPVRLVGHEDEYNQE